MQQTNPIQARQKSLGIFHIIGGVIVAGLLFGAGLMVGQGKIRVGGVPNNPSTRQLSNQIDYNGLDEVYSALRDNYDGNLTNQQVLDGLKHGLAGSTKDPYTEYMSATEAEQFQNDLQGTISGVGARLEKDAEGRIVVVAPLEGSPAQAAGLRAKDVIAAVDGKTTAGMTATEAVLKIRGKKGTKVTLTIVRNQAEQLEMTITRDTIHIPSVTSKMLANGVGYLQVSQFSDDTDELANKAAQKLVADGAQGIVLDLRDNPGGEVVSAVNLSSLWLSKGTAVVEQRKGTTVVRQDKAIGGNILQGKKTVILLNGGSASASEIVALALRDKAGARIIGEKSYGKGVVQQLIQFDDDSSLKVTVGKWYSPNGTNIDKKGIMPDQEVKISEADSKAQNDTQLTTAQEYLK
jgi:carboxyl-terminal processing protease